MTTRHVTWQCDDCRRYHPSYDEARSCEFGHITAHAVAATSKAIADAFAAHGARPETPDDN